MSSLSELGRRIKAIERKISRGVSQPQLAYSSIEDGNVQEYDREGNLVGIIGLQHDGTHVAASVNGPIPPTPAAPTAEDAAGGITVTCSGLFDLLTDVAPMDFLRFDVHTSPSSGFSIDPAITLRASFSSPRGGRVFIPLPIGVHYVRIVCVTASGKYSAASVQDSAEATEAAAGGGALTYWQDTPPVASSIGDLWYKTDSGNLLHRWDGSDWVPVPIGGDAIDTGTVTPQNTQFRPGGGMLQNMIPDPQFTDPAWKAKRIAEDGWDDWTFEMVPNLLTTAPTQYNAGPKVSAFDTGSSSIPEALIDFTLSSATVSGDVLLYTDPIEVEPNYMYQWTMPYNASNDYAPVLRWYDGTMTPIGVELALNVGTETPQNLLSPGAAAFAIITWRAGIDSLPAGDESIQWVQFYHGGAGVGPGQYVARYHVPASLGSGREVVYLARDIPIQKAQKYFGSMSAAMQYCDVRMSLEATTQYGVDEASGVVHAGPILGNSATWQGFRGYSDLDDGTEATLSRVDVILIVELATPGVAGELWVASPGYVASGYSSLDSGHEATFDPGTLIMRGDEIQIYVDSFGGLAAFQTTSSVTAEPMEFGMSRMAGQIYWNVGNYAEMAMSGSVWKVDTGDHFGSQHQLLELNGVTKLASLKSGASSVFEAAISQAKMAFGSAASLIMDATKARLQRDATSYVEISATQTKSAFGTASETLDGTKARLEYDGNSHVEVNATRADIKGPEVRLGNGTTSITAVGDTVTSGKLALAVRQTYDQALAADVSVSNTTTMQNTGLAFPVEAGGVYIVKAELFITSSNSVGDLKLGFGLPAGASWSGWAEGQANGVGTVSTTVRQQVTTRGAGGTTLRLGSPAGGGEHLVKLRARVVVPTTAGTVNLQFAQFTAGAGGPTIQDLSWINVKRVA